MLPDPASLSTSLTTSLPLSPDCSPLPTLWMCLLRYYPQTTSSLSDILAYRIHSQASTLTPLAFSFYTNLLCKPQIDISIWVSCSISDATYSKPNPFSFLANLITMLSPSHSPRLKTRASSMTLFTPSKSIPFLSPFDSTFPASQSETPFLLPLLLSSPEPLPFPDSYQGSSLGCPASLP